MVTMESGVYRVTLGGGAFYIGSAQNFSRREQDHQMTLASNRHCNKWMQNCWNKYGILEFEILELVDVDKLLNREQYYLNIYFGHPKCVNICPTAGSAAGRIPSAEHRAKIGAATRGRKHSAESLAKMVEAATGRKATAETRQKMSESHKAMSDETREKMSAANKGRKHSAETREKMAVAATNRWARKRAAQTDD